MLNSPKGLIGTPQILSSSQSCSKANAAPLRGLRAKSTILAPFFLSRDGDECVT